MCVTSLCLQSLLHLLVLSELKGHFLLSPKMSLYQNTHAYSQGQRRFIKQRKQWATARWGRCQEEGRCYFQGDLPPETWTSSICVLLPGVDTLGAITVFGTGGLREQLNCGKGYSLPPVPYWRNSLFQTGSSVRGRWSPEGCVLLAWAQPCQEPQCLRSMKMAKPSLRWGSEAWQSLRLAQVGVITNDWQNKYQP